MSAPRLTVVLVVYRDQAYLREAVRSVLDQSFALVELVAIDNASPDHGPEILGELAATDDRLIVLRLERTVTIGEARNIALERATGDYVWFLESTDVLPPGALAAVAARLDETRPQVLVVDDTREETFGRPTPGPNGRILSKVAVVETFTLEQRPEAARLAVDAWNKIVARMFLRTL